MINSKILLSCGMLVFLLTIVSAAQCVATFSDVYIWCPNDYCQFGVNKPIENITIELSSNLPEVEGVDIWVFLCKKCTTSNCSDCTSTNELKRVKAVSDKNGKIYLGGSVNPYSFGYTPKSTADLSVKVIVDPDSSTPYISIKNLDVVESLDLKLICPPQGYVGKEVKCDVKTYIGSVLKESSISKYSISQGGEELSDKTLFPDAVSFISTIVGSVDIFVEVSSEGYLSDSDSVQISISHPTIEDSFLVDNKDFFLYTGVGIPLGTHQLKFKIEEGGEPISIQRVEGEIRTPSGQVVPVTFNEKNGEYVTNYNFEQAGQTYQLSGKIEFVDITKNNGEDLLFEYQIITASGIVDDNKTSITLIIVGISISVLIGFGVLIYMFRGGKRKR